MGRWSSSREEVAVDYIHPFTKRVSTEWFLTREAADKWVERKGYPIVTIEVRIHELDY